MPKSIGILAQANLLHQTCIAKTAISTLPLKSMKQLSQLRFEQR